MKAGSLPTLRSCQPVNRARNRLGSQPQPLVPRQPLPRSRMKHQVLRAKGQRPLNLPAKRRHALLAHFLGLAAHVHQVAGMDDERAHIKLGAQLAHPRSLFGVNLRRAPHARARCKNLKCIGANLPRPLHGFRRPARRAQMHTDSPGHGDSLIGELSKK